MNMKGDMMGPHQTANDAFSKFRCNPFDAFSVYVFLFKSGFHSYEHHVHTHHFQMPRAELWLFCYMVVVTTSSSSSSAFHIMPSGLFPLQSNWNYVSYRQSVGLLGRVNDQPCRKAATYIGQHTKVTRTDFHASSGIRNHDPNVWAYKDISRLRPHGHFDRNIYYIMANNITVSGINNRSISLETQTQCLTQS
jgi:hypothetical protein